eukprot:Nk52_evm31s2402 gene=Nk52_evmTU31s2402
MLIQESVNCNNNKHHCQDNTNTTTNPSLAGPSLGSSSEASVHLGLGARPIHSINRLPKELILTILRKLKPRELSSASAVCRLWYKLVNQGIPWEELCFRKWNDFPLRPIPACCGVQIKQKNDPVPGDITSSASSNSNNQINTTVLIDNSAEKWRRLYHYKSFVRKNISLVGEAIGCSSVDDDTQGIENTLIRFKQAFWSSRGSDSESSNEWLCYRLASPFCIVNSVTFKVFCADFQRGSPIYAPKSVVLKFFVDVDCQNPVHVSGEYPVQKTKDPQTFFLDQPVIGSYLKIELIGRRTKQSLDRMYYTCLDFVCAHGTSLRYIRNNIVANALINSVLLRKTSFEEFKGSRFTVESIAKDLRKLHEYVHACKYGQNFVGQKLEPPMCINSILNTDHELCKYFITFDSAGTNSELGLIST